MILYWVFDERSETAVPFFLRFILAPFIRLIIKKPGGPSIVIQSPKPTGMAKKLADIYETEGRTHKEIIKEAYFLAECGHPNIIYREPMQRERIEWLKQNIRGSLLEIGCSTGFVLNYVGGGVGVDVDELRLEYARRTYPGSKFLLADAAKLPFMDKEFDTVMIPDILEHVEQEHAQKIINEAVRVGKKLVVTVPNAGKKNYNKTLVENPEHRWFPTVKIMETMVGLAAKMSFSKGEDFIYSVVGE